MDEIEKQETISKLNDLLEQTEEEVGVVGVAFGDAVIALGNRWIQAIENDSKENLLKDIDLLVSKLHAFKCKVEDVMPFENGGNDGILGYEKVLDSSHSAPRIKG